MVTEADDHVSNVDELPGLTPKQMAFVQALLKGKTASDAYREAYDCAGMAANSIWVAASRLRSDAKVALWLRHYRLVALQEGTLSFEAHLGELTRLREHALDAKQVAAAVQAEHARDSGAGI
jgi:phage terminase small subunit